MRIFLVTRKMDKVTEYDTFDSFVCVAQSGGDAMSIHPRNGKSLKEGGAHDWTEDIPDLSFTDLGEANYGMDRGVILASFNAG